jgi:hypothetical protein
VSLAAAVFLQRIGGIGLGQSNRALHFPLGQLQSLVQLLLELAITHLLEDVGVPRLVDLEGFVAVGADDFVHGGWIFLLVELVLPIPIATVKLLHRLKQPFSLIVI